PSPGSVTLTLRTSRRMPNSRSVAMRTQRPSSAMAFKFFRMGFTSRDGTATFATWNADNNPSRLHAAFIHLLLVMVQGTIQQVPEYFLSNLYRVVVSIPAAILSIAH